MEIAKDGEEGREYIEGSIESFSQYSTEKSLKTL